jgi:hypothetical protein
MVQIRQLAVQFLGVAIIDTASSVWAPENGFFPFWRDEPADTLQLLIVTVDPERVAVYAWSEFRAGPWITSPLVLYWEPWHGQVETPFWKAPTVHPWCVHLRLNTKTVVSLER